MAHITSLQQPTSNFFGGVADLHRDSFAPLPQSSQTKEVQPLDPMQLRQGLYISPEETTPAQLSIEDVLGFASDDQNESEDDGNEFDIDFDDAEFQAPFQTDSLNPMLCQRHLSQPNFAALESTPYVPPSHYGSQSPFSAMVHSRELGVDALNDGNAPPFKYINPSSLELRRPQGASYPAPAAESLSRQGSQQQHQQLPESPRRSTLAQAQATRQAPANVAELNRRQIETRQQPPQQQQSLSQAQPQQRQLLPPVQAQSEYHTAKDNDLDLVDMYMMANDDDTLSIDLDDEPQLLSPRTSPASMTEEVKPVAASSPHTPASSEGSDTEYTESPKVRSPMATSPDVLSPPPEKSRKKATRRRAPKAMASSHAQQAAYSGAHVCTMSFADGSECHRSFTRPYDLARHQETIHAPVRKMYKCSTCGEKSKTFSRLDALSRHMRLKHAE